MLMSTERPAKSETIGLIVKASRTKKGWTVKQLIERLQPKLPRGKLSPAYITRIEQYDEIPSPDFLCTLAEVLDLDSDRLLRLARQTKVQRFESGLEKKYREAVGQYRLQKKRED
jgi:transcriptional regulator with XRE-family HTH domain